MCGITALLGIECGTILIDSLRQLQNRGYDSSGISSILNNRYIVNKYASTNSETAIEILEKVNVEHKNSINSIGHTRWATHGAKTDINSHPHISMCGKFSIVHNGIIENFMKLKKDLLQKKYIFKSETDTEVIVNLLSFFFTECASVKEAIEKTTEKLQGTWGVVIQYLNEPNKLYCTRKGSPLLIGNNNKFSMVVSEQNGFCNYFDEYMVLDNRDICEIVTCNGKISITTKKTYDKKKIVSQLQSLTPDPYPHWTLKEIFEQTDSSLRAISLGGRVLSNNEVKLGGLEDYKHILSKIKNIILLGCGTSLYAAQIGVSYIKDICDFNVVLAFDGAEFSEKDIPKIGSVTILFLSQSGETKDLHRCINIAKKHHIFTIGVINVPDSQIARDVNCGCYLNAGREVGVASTKSFVSQVIILSLIAIWFSQIKNIHNDKRVEMIRCLKKLHIDIQKTLDISERTVGEFLNFFNDKNSCFILGKGKGEHIAKEGALKLKELTYIHAEGYSTSSLKHGPFALLEKDFPVIMVAPKNEYYFKSINAYEEIKSRHGKIIYISDEDTPEIEHKIILPKNKTYQDLLCIIPIQLLTYKLSIMRGINPDIPRNLAKVVTVE